MFKLIESDENLKLYEHKGYQIAVIKGQKNKTIRVSLATSNKMSYLPVLTLCGNHFLIDPPVMKDDKIDELISGIENAKDFIADFNKMKNEL